MLKEAKRDYYLWYSHLLTISSSYKHGILFLGERLSEEVLGKKSIWRTNNGAECSVEQVALEYYSTKGFKG